jgi:NADH-quinone oxidoreductase subunit E
LFEKAKKGMSLLKLSEEEREITLSHVAFVLKNFEHGRENLIPILQQVQGKLGYLPSLAMEKVAEALDIPAVDVFGVASFYNQFRFYPPGDTEVKVCMGTACYIVGGKIALDSFERRLDIKEGQTTKDRKFSLERVACVGCCTMAPVVVVNDHVEGRVTPTRVDGILLGLNTGNAHGEDEEKAAQVKEGGQES